MGMGKKLALGALALAPLIALIVAVWALFQDGTEYEAVFFVAITISGLLDAGIATWYIPHVYDNKRLGQYRILWVVLLGIPYITVAPLYWAIYVLPEKPGDRVSDEQEGPSGGAWYADPWGEAPYRWWDGNGWTDWVTGPPPQ